MVTIGIDIGSISAKAAAIADGRLLGSKVILTGYNARQAGMSVFEGLLKELAIDRDAVDRIVATGYGRNSVDFADQAVTEITCHAAGAHFQDPEVRAVIDIGGQDSKSIKLVNGKVADFIMNDKCAAGTGRFLEVIADALGVPLAEIGRISLLADNPARISNTCTVFAEQEIVSQLAGGETGANLIAGIHDAVATRVYAIANKLKVEPDVAITGGGAKNIGLVQALEAKCGSPVLVPPEPLITGALGAALIGRETFEKARKAGRPLPRNKSGLEEARFFS